MGAIQIEFRQIQIVWDGQDALLPDLFQTAIVAPLGKVQVDRTVADFFFFLNRVGSQSEVVPIGNPYAANTECS